ncbi:procollagen C-endopeptidase enhancer 1-like [Amblyomma americanum]
MGDLLLVAVFTAALASACAQRPAVVGLRHGVDTQIRDLVSGIVESPGFTRGQWMPHGFQGAVTILAPRGYNKIRLDFTDFDLETSPQCNADSVLIREGGSTMRTMCSDVLPRPYLSISRAVTVLFVTDKMKSSRGFSLRFTATNNRGGCIIFDALFIQLMGWHGVCLEALRQLLFRHD